MTSTSAWTPSAVLASESLAETADVLLVAGDLTRHGTPAEAEVLAAEVATVPVPVVIVLGNHDYESDAADEVRAVMESAGATVLDGDSVVLPVGDVRVGIAGTPGFGGGFRGASCSEFGEPLMKAFVAPHPSHGRRALPRRSPGWTPTCASP